MPTNGTRQEKKIIPLATSEMLIPFINKKNSTGNFKYANSIHKFLHENCLLHNFPIEKIHRSCSKLSNVILKDKTQT